MIPGAAFRRPVVSQGGIVFGLLGTLVNVRWTFFLTSVLLGFRLGSWLPVIVWIVVVFVAVLLHELGHAMAARYYGQRPQIELYGLGGVTSWEWQGEVRWYQRVIISLAGPGIGLVIGAVLYLLAAWNPIQHSFVLWLATRFFLWVTLGWGLFNLFPVLPLDGGHALQDVLEHRLGGDRARLLARKVSVVFGVAGAAAGIYFDQIWAGFLLGIFAFDNWQRMRGLPGVHLPG